MDGFFIKERRNPIVNINGVYEIPRPEALELIRAVKEQVAALNGSVREKINCLHACTDFMVFEFMFTVVIEIDGKERFFDYTEVGEAYAREKGKEFSMARVAVTRAMKRAIHNHYIAKKKMSSDIHHTLLSFTWLNLKLRNS